MSYLIIWSEHARADLQHIYDFIAEDSIYYAEIEIVKIKNATEILLKNPTTGRMVPEIENKEIREIIQGNYRIIYKIIDKEQVAILTVHHGARLFKTNMFITPE